MDAEADERCLFLRLGIAIAEDAAVGDVIVCVSLSLLYPRLACVENRVQTKAAVDSKVRIKPPAKVTGRRQREAVSISLSVSSRTDVTPTRHHQHG